MQFLDIEEYLTEIKQHDYRNIIFNEGITLNKLILYDVNNKSPYSFETYTMNKRYDKVIDNIEVKYRYLIDQKKKVKASYRELSFELHTIKNLSCKFEHAYAVSIYK